MAGTYQEYVKTAKWVTLQTQYEVTQIITLQRKGPSIASWEEGRKGRRSHDPMILRMYKNTFQRVPKVESQCSMVNMNIREFEVFYQLNLVDKVTGALWRGTVVSLGLY